MTTDFDKVFEKIQGMHRSEFECTGKYLGSGAFGQVREIKAKQKTFAGKLIEIKKDGEDKWNKSEIHMSLELKGPNIIRINRIYEEKIDNRLYDLIIMEKAALKDLGKLNKFYHSQNLLKTIYDPFQVKVSENLCRFYVSQIIKGLEVLDRNEFIHFDIKPENLLVSINLCIKISDFSLLRNTRPLTHIKIPGGTNGYLTPEYYEPGPFSIKDAKTQDYFALGSTIFALRFGKPMFQKIKKDNKEKPMLEDRIIDNIERSIAFIRSQVCIDKDFRYFLIKLVQYKPGDRLNFEEIYRNKWVNKNIEHLRKILYGFENDEEKLIMELQKSDYLYQRKSIRNENKKNDGKKFTFVSGVERKYKRKKNKSLVDDK